MIIKIFASFIFCLVSVFCNDEDHRIINGNPVTIEQYPYLASIRYYDNHLCSGVIVNEEHILTSIQCVDRTGFDTTKLSIRVGATKHFDGQIVGISSIQLNPDGQKNIESKENDIAIITLATKLTFSDQIDQIDLLNVTSKISDGTTAQLIGWKIVNDTDNKVSDVLLKSEGTLISYYDCNELYGVNMISLDMICMKTSETGICRGNVGGPLVLNNELIGIASWNYGCNDEYYPDVFASIAFHYNWILKNI